MLRVEKGVDGVTKLSGEVKPLEGRRRLKQAMEPGAVMVADIPKSTSARHVSHSS